MAHSAWKCKFGPPPASCLPPCRSSWRMRWWRSAVLSWRPRYAVTNSRRHSHSSSPWLHGVRAGSRSRANEIASPASAISVAAPIVVASAPAVIGAVAVAITVAVVTGRRVDRRRRDRYVFVILDIDAGSRSRRGLSGGRPRRRARHPHTSAAVERGCDRKTFLALPLDLAPVAAVGGLDQAAAWNFGD